MTLPYLHIYLFAAHLFRRVVFGQLSLRTVGGIQGVGRAVQYWAQPRRKKRSVDFVRLEDEEEAGRIGLSAHYKSEEIIMRFCTRRIHGQKRTRPGIFFFGFQFLINLLLLFSMFPLRRTHPLFPLMAYEPLCGQHLLHPPDCTTPFASLFGHFLYSLHRHWTAVAFLAVGTGPPLKA
jgi:hypothetical protein